VQSHCIVYSMHGGVHYSVDILYTYVVYKSIIIQIVCHTMVVVRAWCDGDIVLPELFGTIW
jgi:hypothetical protein